MYQSLNLLRQAFLRSVLALDDLDWELLTGNAQNTRVILALSSYQLSLKREDGVGKEFRRWARAALPESNSRAMQLAELRQKIAVALMRGTAAAMLASAANTHRPWLSNTQTIPLIAPAASGS